MSFLLSQYLFLFIGQHSFGGLNWFYSFDESILSSQFSDKSIDCTRILRPVDPNYTVIEDDHPTSGRLSCAKIGGNDDLPCKTKPYSFLVGGADPTNLMNEMFQEELALMADAVSPFNPVYVFHKNYHNKR